MNEGDVKTNIGLAAAALRRFAPQEYKQFVMTLKVYEQTIVHQLVIAAPNDLQSAQGRAQAIQTLCMFLEKAGEK